MAGAIRDKCGVLGLYSSQIPNVSTIIQPALSALNHRGQESWGVMTNLSENPYKRMGLVLEKHLYNKDIRHLKSMKGNCGVGHVRYSTRGSSTIGNAHPIQINNHYKKFFIGQNGTIENSDEIASDVIKDGYALDDTCTDTEIFGLRVSQIYEESHDFNKAFQETAKSTNGSYSFVFLRGNEIYAARDPKGWKPLCIGYEKESDTFIVASESVALYRLGAVLVRDVEPGEFITINENGIDSFKFADSASKAHCVFEYTYFAHPSSVIDGINVYMARKNMGRGLGKNFPVKDADVVIPVPDSARPAALGYSEVTGIPFDEGLIKDKYNKTLPERGFMDPETEQRIEVAKGISSIKPVINNRNVVVVDDSIVRGTSSQQIVQKLRRAGAKKVGFVITFPPIKNPCYMGIDFPTYDELIAYRVAKDVDDILEIGDRVAKEIGADFVYYNDIESLRKQIGLASSMSCNSCTTGDYSCLSKQPRSKTRLEMKGR